MTYKTICLALLLAAASADAQTPDARARVLVQPAWLAEHLRDPDLVLLHVGPRAEYDARAHPAARDIWTTRSWRSRIASPGALTLQMPPAEELRRRLAAAGISNDSRIVLYFGRENPYVSPTARVLFTLDYAGLGDRASVLDGGLDAWVRRVIRSRPIASRSHGTLAPLTVRPLIVDAEFVKANLATRRMAIVDASNARLLQRRADRRWPGGATQDRPHRRRAQRAVQRHAGRGLPAEARGRVAEALRSRRCQAR